MKAIKLFLLLCLFSLGIGCSSGDDANTETISDDFLAGKWNWVNSRNKGSSEYYELDDCDLESFIYFKENNRVDEYWYEIFEGECIGGNYTPQGTYSIEGDEIWILSNDQYNSESRIYINESSNNKLVLEEYYYYNSYLVQEVPNYSPFIPEEERNILTFERD